MSAVAIVEAPAKLTLSLRITGVRADGYHLIDAEMVTLDLADRLTITPGGRGLAITGPYAAGVPTDDGNLVSRALALAGRRAAVHLYKAIPHGGGLGGGSADAAAVLRWCGWTDLVAASRLGADIPFCVVGGRARVRGIGEDVQPLTPEPLDITLIIPAVHVSTPAVYRAWDELGGPSADGPNDLAPAALHAVPELVEWRNRITRAAGVEPTLAGSGATWFLIGHHRRLDERLDGAEVVLTRTRTGVASAPDAPT